MQWTKIALHIAVPIHEQSSWYNRGCEYSLQHLLSLIDVFAKLSEDDRLQTNDLPCKCQYSLGLINTAIYCSLPQRFVIANDKSNKMFWMLNMNMLQYCRFEFQHHMYLAVYFCMLIKVWMFFFGIWKRKSEWKISPKAQPMEDQSVLPVPSRSLGHIYYNAYITLILYIGIGLFNLVHRPEMGHNGWQSDNRIFAKSSFYNQYEFLILNFVKLDLKTWKIIV